MMLAECLSLVSLCLGLLGSLGSPLSFLGSHSPPGMFTIHSQNGFLLRMGHFVGKVMKLFLLGIESLLGITAGAHHAPPGWTGTNTPPIFLFNGQEPPSQFLLKCQDISRSGPSGTPQCVGTHTSCSTAITKHTVCNKGLINIIFGQQLTLCYTTMHGVQEWDNIRTFLNYIRNTHDTL